MQVSDCCAVTFGLMCLYGWSDFASLFLHCFPFILDSNTKYPNHKRYTLWCRSLRFLRLLCHLSCFQCGKAMRMGSVFCSTHPCMLCGHKEIVFTNFRAPLCLILIFLFFFFFFLRRRGKKNKRKGRDERVLEKQGN